MTDTRKPLTARQIELIVASGFENDLRNKAFRKECKAKYGEVLTAETLASIMLGECVLVAMQTEDHRRHTEALLGDFWERNTHAHGANNNDKLVAVSA